MADRAADRIRIGQEDHVAFLERAGVTIEERPDVAAELAHNHPPQMIGDQREGIALLADARRHRGAHQRGVHLDPCVAQRVLDDVERDRVDLYPLERGLVRLDDLGQHQLASAGVIRMLPKVSTVPTCRVSISVVESISTTIAGPGITSPASSSARS